MRCLVLLHTKDFIALYKCIRLVIDYLFDFNASSEQTVAFTMNRIHVVTVMSEGMRKSSEFDKLRLAKRNYENQILQHFKSLKRKSNTSVRSF